MKKYCRGSYSMFWGITIGLILVAIVFPQKTLAKDQYAVAVPIYTQHLPTPDPNGNTGYLDCTIATTAMALEGISVDKKDISYSNVRQLARSYYPDLTRGITLPEISGLIPFATDNTVMATYIRTSASDWEETLTRQLASGYPVVAHIDDWRYLPGHSGHGDAAHTVVISGISPSGITYIDPWDGREYFVSKQEFATAWSTGYYSWGGLYFQKIEKATSFSEILRRRRFLRSA